MASGNVRTRRVVLREARHKETAHQYVDEAYIGPDCVLRMTIAVYEEKSREQEEKYHAMIGDIARQLEFMGRKRDVETWKRLLIEAFVHVMREDAMATGKPDPFRGKGEVVPSLDGKRVVQLGVQSRRFGKGVASAFIEYLYSFGSERGVRWSSIYGSTK